MMAREHFKQVKAALREHWVEILVLLLGVLAIFLKFFLGLHFPIIVV